MELNRDGQKRELKLHGTYGFPVYGDRKRISSYATGSFPWHWHDEVEFTLVAGGGMEYRVNDNKYDLRAGQGLFCNAGALHAGSMAGGDCDYISLTFHPRLLAGFEGSAIGAEYVAPLVESPALPSLALDPATPWQRELLAGLEQVYRLLAGKPPLYQMDIQRALLGCWAVLFRNCAQDLRQAPAEDPEKLRRQRLILAYIHQHYAQRLTLDEIAREVGLCKSECCRFFKRQMGSSLFQYILDYRVGKSLALLRQGCSVNEAAAQTGFPDPSYFSKVFREKTGRAPSQYRREALEGRNAP